DPQMADGGHLRRHGDGVRGAAGQAARGSWVQWRRARGGAPPQASPGGSALGKLNALDVSLAPSRRYTLWTGLFGGLFLSLSYFGTDQSQVQRYIGGASLREGRLGLMFNAVLKIPMQFLILLLGALLFVFYQFESPPVFFNRAEWQRHAEGPAASRLQTLEAQYAAAVGDTQAAIRAWLGARGGGDA